MQPAQTAPAASGNPFTNPDAPGGSGPAPRVSDLEGCLVAFSPTRFTAAGTEDNLTGYQGAPPNDRVTTNVLVLQTPRGPVPIGGTPETDASKPHTHTFVGPAKFSGIWVNNSNIVKALAPGGQPLVGAMILGRIVRSDVGRRPWNLVSVEGTPDMALAVQIHTQLAMGAIQYNEPQPIGGGFAAAPNTVQYAPVPSPYPPPQTPSPAYAYAPQVPPVQVQDATMANMAQGYTSPAQAQADAFAAWQAQQAAGNVAAQQAVQAQFPGAQVVAGYPVAPAAPVGPPAPQGWTEQAWGGLTAEQKSQVLRSMGLPG